MRPAAREWPAAAGAGPPAVWLGVIVLHLAAAGGTPARAAPSVDELSDLTGRASAIVTLKDHDNFANEYTFDVKVHNHMATTIEADSLVLVLDHVTDLGGKSTLDRVEAIGRDGETKDGRPYYRVPGPALPPYGESGSLTIRLKNTDYVALWTPSFRIRGIALPDPGRRAADSLQTLIDLLIKKGLLTEEEWNEAAHPSPPAKPSR